MPIPSRASWIPTASNWDLVPARMTIVPPSSVVTNVTLATIGQDDAYRYTGHIFLQAGNTYTVSGSRDDTLMVKLGGSQVYGVGYNNYGSFSATAFTPAVSGYYSIEVTAYNGDGSLRYFVLHSRLVLKVPSPLSRRTSWHSSPSAIWRLLRSSRVRLTL